MASGPYQSNLLRFFVGQYWQGLARHRRAVRETRSTIALGSEIAAAVVLSPVVMVARASQKRLQTLKASVQKLRLSLGHARSAVKLFDFSGFDRVSAASECLNLQVLQPFLKSRQLGGAVVEAAVAEKAAADAVVEIAITEAVVAEAAMVRTLIAVADSLSPEQWDGFAQVPQVLSEKQPLVRWWKSVRSFVSTTLARQIGPKDGVLVTQSESVEEESNEDKLVRSAGVHELSDLPGGLSTAGKITGVACELKTRSLVLVRDYWLIWKGLSSEQQQQLHRTIEALLAESAVTMAEWQTAVDVLGEFALPSGRALAKARSAAMDWTGSSKAVTELTGDENSASLAVPSVSFWVEVLRAVAWLQRRVSVARRLPGKQLQLASSGPALKEEASFVAQLKSAVAGLRGGAIVRRAVVAILPWKGAAIFSGKGFAITRRFSGQALAENKQDKKALEKMNRTERKDYIDASVVTATYVEHPLEALLNWVDRFLLWLENGWRRLIDWLRQQH